MPGNLEKNNSTSCGVHDRHYAKCNKGIDLKPVAVTRRQNMQHPRAGMFTSGSQASREGGGKVRPKSLCGRACTVCYVALPSTQEWEIRFESYLSVCGHKTCDYQCTKRLCLERTVLDVQAHLKRITLKTAAQCNAIQ